jgi:hypothetical protein
MSFKVISLVTDLFVLMDDSIHDTYIFSPAYR